MNLNENMNLNEKSMKSMSTAGVWKDQLEKLLEQNTNLVRLLKASEIERQQISSENSELMKELRRKSDLLVKLNEQLATLSRSDLISRENKRLLRENETLREEWVAEVRDVALTLKTTSMNLEGDYIKNMNQLSRERTQYKNLIQNEKEKINNEVEKQLDKARQDLEHEFNLKMEKMRLWIKWGVLYGLAATILAVLFY